ncbi:histidinol-phosphatase [Treponema sp.]|uniref:histidinol-phosphatase n=1 Tax=Treponema sp. TaxID=166 RepID=UPI003F126AE7
MVKSNFHTHSTFCDGKNTPEEIVAAALERNLDILGFSSHSMYPFSSGWHIPSNSHRDYADEIQRLKKKYSGKIKIYTGFEADYIPGICAPDFESYREFDPDFLIGSVHFVPCREGFFEADGNPQDVRRAIDCFFGGNVKKAVQEYFFLEREMLAKCYFTFLGHADLIRLQNLKGAPLFDENASWYKKELKETARAAARAGVCVEVNTGGILRSGMKAPYPSPYFLSLLRELDVPVTINSDAHSAEGIDWWFEEAVEYIKKSGYTELSYYEDGLLKSQHI